MDTAEEHYSPELPRPPLLGDGATDDEQKPPAIAESDESRGMAGEEGNMDTREEHYSPELPRSPLLGPTQMWGPGSPHESSAPSPTLSVRSPVAP